MSTKRRATREEREHREAINRAKDAIECFLHGYPVASHLHQSANREDILAALSDYNRDLFLMIEARSGWKP